MFGWEGGHVVVYRISEKGGEIPRINLMLTKQGENTHYRTGTMKASTFANAACTAIRGENCSKGTSQNVKDC